MRLLVIAALIAAAVSFGCNGQEQSNLPAPGGNYEQLSRLSAQGVQPEVRQPDRPGEVVFRDKSLATGKASVPEKAFG